MKNVIIILGKGYTKEMVVQEIKQEGYKDNFYFANMNEIETFHKQFRIADEVWTFGDVMDDYMYVYAASQGADIWRMG